MPEIRTSRDVVVSQVGTDLYSTFFEGYTRRQWGLCPSQLDKSVAARIPARTSIDDRYFLDTFQAMPADGFSPASSRTCSTTTVSTSKPVSITENWKISPLPAC